MNYYFLLIILYSFVIIYIYIYIILLNGNQKKKKKLRDIRVELCKVQSADKLQKKSKEI